MVLITVVKVVLVQCVKTEHGVYAYKADNRLTEMSDALWAETVIRVVLHVIAVEVEVTAAVHFAY